MAQKKAASSNQIGYFNSAVPMMPEGYYSGDKPNPNLRTFVTAHIKEHPFDPATDNYNVPAFDKPIETTKATAIYNMHTYWSKKPHDAIRQYIRHFSHPGDLVLDSFCGSGGTALAALIEGRKAVAIDRSPAATFITKNYCTPVNTRRVLQAYEEIKKQVVAQLGHMYATVDRQGASARMGYTTWSQTILCIKCLRQYPLAEPDLQPGAKSFVHARSTCPFCYEPVPSSPEFRGMIPVRITYTSDRERRGSRDIFSDPNGVFQEDSKRALQYFEQKVLPNGYIDAEFPIGTITRQPRNQGLTSVSSIFTSRALTFLVTLQDEIRRRDDDVQGFLLFCLEGIVLTASKMYKEETRNIQSGTYYCPPIMREVFPLNLLDYKVDQAIKGIESAHNSIAKYEICISTSDARRLDIPTNSIDYIFTDPPYSGKVQFAEANFVWEHFLGFDTSYWKDEIIVSESRGIGMPEWRDSMLLSFQECFRVLKPGRYLSLCYHDSSGGTWELVQDIMAEAGFIVADKDIDVLYIEVTQKSHKQRTSDNVQKRDLVINFMKPKVDDLLPSSPAFASEDRRTFTETALRIIQDYLSAHPGISKDKVYDEVVGRMVRVGEMEVHDFDALLGRIAEPAADDKTRWFLKEVAEKAVDEAEERLEQVAAKSVKDFITPWLKKNPDSDGVHYSDIFEHYLYAVKDKPRRQLQDWLMDYLYKTAEGTYRLASDEDEEEVKARGREAGTNRRIRRFIAFLVQGLAVPARERPNDPTLADWVRHCKRTGLYEQGRLLYEKGGFDLDSLPEAVQVGVEEDYQVCVRMLGRVAGGDSAKKTTRGRKTKK